jgi:predicted TIM-barrel fold metal-dependent hydrolase
MASYLSRREALGTIAASAVGSAMMSQLASASDDPPTRRGYIDAHVHVWTDDTDKYPLAKGHKKEGMKPATFTPEELLAHARPLDISRIVLIQMSFYGYDNRYMLDMMADYPGVFSGVAVIDPDDKPAEKMRELKGKGVRGFRIVSDGKDAEKWLDGDPMATMWKTAAEEKLSMCCLINPDALASVDKMCERFPDTPLVVDHFARVGMKGDIKEEDLANLCRLARHKNVAVKVSAFYALGKKKSPYDDLAAMAKRLVEAFGAQRLMWATDCPFQVQGDHTYVDSLALVKDRLDFLTAKDKDWLLRGTAERVFFS